MVLYNSGTARAYGCSSTSSRRLEREMRRRGAFSLLEFKCVCPEDTSILSVPGLWGEGQIAPLFMWISRRSTAREQTRQISRYKSITVIQTSKVKNVADISSMP